MVEMTKIATFTQAQEMTRGWLASANILSQTSPLEWRDMAKIILLFRKENEYFIN
jgi:hypothetical protein